MTPEEKLARRREDEHKQNHLPPIDPVRMFLRTLEQYDEVLEKFHDVEIQFREHKNMVAEKFRDQNAIIEKLVERMEKQVSFTGHKNSADIEALKTTMTNFNTQVFDDKTGVITQFTHTRDWQANFNKVVTGCFITTILGLVVWLIQQKFFP